ncbi:uncharacterized protein LOC134536486 [Bacillus rossius redtenbacheri]|uniref:uncharacterized protein LOC134536486 n=1 Tax=Bacillus rossius redtenbacheri TaxID=93214 RepID=UPI002FDCAC82
MFAKEVYKSETLEEGLHGVATLLNMSHTWAVVFSVILYRSVYKDITLAVTKNFWEDYLDKETSGSILRRSVHLEETLAKGVFGLCAVASFAQELMPLPTVELALEANDTVVRYRPPIDLFTPFDRSRLTQFVIDRVLMLMLVLSLAYISVICNSYYNSLLINCASHFELLNAAVISLSPNMREDGNVEVKNGGEGENQLLFVLMRHGVYCYYGNHVTSQAERTYQCAYSVGWYDLSPDFKRMTQIMMARAQRVVAISSAMMGDLSMESYADELKALTTVEITLEANETVAVYRITQNMWTLFERSEFAQFVIDRVLVLTVVLILAYISVICNSYYNSLLINCASHFELLNAAVMSLSPNMREDGNLEESNGDDRDDKVSSPDVMHDVDVVVHNYDGMDTLRDSRFHEMEEMSIRDVHEPEIDRTTAHAMDRMEKKLFGLVEVHQAERTYQCAYSVGWYDLSPDFKRMTQIMMARAQRVVAISSAMMGDLSMESYADVTWRTGHEPSYRDYGTHDNPGAEVVWRGGRRSRGDADAMSDASRRRETQAVEIQGPPPGLEAAHAALFTRGAVDYLCELVAAFDRRADELQTARLARRCAARGEAWLPTFREPPAGDWRVAALPPRLRDRRLDLGDVSPADEAHLVAALRAQVSGVQVDLDDGHCPTWRNQLGGLHNVCRCVEGSLPGVAAVDHLPVLMLRPRAWNLVEDHVMVRGRRVPAPLFDFALLAHHVGARLANQGAGPFFYLSKLEGAEEARLWDDVFSWAERRAGLSHGTIKACVLIENILSSFELDGILYALKDHSLGLNCGMWDYAASIICKFGDRPQFVLPDRGKYVSMEQHFLKCYLQLVVRTAHRRGAPATGGMVAALLPPGGEDPDRREEVVRKVKEAKRREIEAGVDGFLVYDVGLVPYMNELWREAAPAAARGREILPRDLLAVPRGGATAAGLKHNAAVALLFARHWLRGEGHFALRGAVEDSATAEISRAQVWQWIRHGVVLEDSGAVVTLALVRRLVTQLVTELVTGDDHHQERRRLQAAAELFLDVVGRRDCPDFWTSVLSESPVFRACHEGRDPPSSRL